MNTLTDRFIIMMALIAVLLFLFNITRMIIWGCTL